MLARGIIGAILAIAAAGSAAAEPIVLKLGSPAPPWSFINTEVLGPWAEAVSADSGGTLKVQTFFGGTLGNFGNTYDRVADQVVDIGFILTAFAAGKFKLADVGALPFEVQSSSEAAAGLWGMFEKGVSAKEFDVAKPLGLWAFPNSAIHSREPIRTLDDFRGKKLIATNAIAAKIVPALGATPISFRPDESYTALQRGATDGVLMPFIGMETFKIQEVTKYHLDAALGGDPAAIIINRKRYDALPPEAKAAIDKHSYLLMSRKLGQVTQTAWQRGRDKVKDSVTTLTPEQEAEWKKRLEHIAVEWSKGVPDGEKALATFRAEVAAARAAK